MIAAVLPFILSMNCAKSIEIMRKIVFTDCFLGIIIEVKLNDGGIDTAKLFHFNYSNDRRKKCRVEK